MNYILKNIQSSILYLFCLLLLGCEKDAPIVDEEVEKQLIAQLKSCQRDDSDFSFFHVSDTHGSSYTLSYMVSLLNKTDALFGIVTGDIVMTPSMQHVISLANKPIFLMPGNHDIYDNMSQYGFRNDVLNASPWISEMCFGDSIVNYYYVDFGTNKKNRLICLDQYEIEAVGVECAYNNVMSQKQVNWLISCLESAEHYDSIIIAIHCGFGNSQNGGRDFSNKNSFITITGGNPESYEYSGPGNPCMVPDIINAYMTGNNISKTYPSGYTGIDLNVQTHFNSPHSNFILYIGGHIHCDIIEYLSYYPNQLQSIISTAYYVGASQYDDLIREAKGINAIVINDCFVNLSNREIQIVRL